MAKITVSQSRILLKRFKMVIIETFLTAYAQGKRHFCDLDFEAKGSAQGLDLSGVIFENCFLFLDFRGAKLTQAQFIKCNIKTADFTGADLTHAVIKNCAVESTNFKGAKTDHLVFEENYYYGQIMNQSDFEEIFKNAN